LHPTCFVRTQALILPSIYKEKPHNTERTEWSFLFDLIKVLVGTAKKPIFYLIFLKIPRSCIRLKILNFFLYILKWLIIKTLKNIILIYFYFKNILHCSIKPTINYRFHCNLILSWLHGNHSKKKGIFTMDQ
jgi:hypothetical protein